MRILSLSLCTKSTVSSPASTRLVWKGYSWSLKHTWICISGFAFLCTTHRWRNGKLHQSSLCCRCHTDAYWTHRYPSVCFHSHVNLAFFFYDKVQIILAKCYHAKAGLPSITSAITKPTSKCTSVLPLKPWNQTPAILPQQLAWSHFCPKLSMPLAPCALALPIIVTILHWLRSCCH